MRNAECGMKRWSMEHGAWSMEHGAWSKEQKNAVPYALCANE